MREKRDRKRREERGGRREGRIYMRLIAEKKSGQFKTEK